MCAEEHFLIPCERTDVVGFVSRKSLEKLVFPCGCTIVETQKKLGQNCNTLVNMGLP